MKTEIASYMDPNTPLAMRLFFRSCVESSPNFVEPKPVLALPQNRHADGAHVQLHQLKRALLQAVLEETCDAGLLKRLCGAANEAAELAWTTAHPLLVFPCLFEELADRVRTEYRSRPGWTSQAPGMAMAGADAEYGENAVYWAGRRAQSGDRWNGV
jgi:hypothetical protein